jgi:hypothetical protein
MTPISTGDLFVTAGIMFTTFLIEVALFMSIGMF